MWQVIFAFFAVAVAVAVVSAVIDHGTDNDGGDAGGGWDPFD